MHNNRRLSVFLCHSSNDKLPARQLYERLVTKGFDAWLDQEKLIGGQDWHFEITKAVENSDAIIVCLSSQSITKEGYVQKEIKFALDVADEKPEGTIFIIPARLENCEIPQRIKRYQWVDLFSTDGYERLLKALQTIKRKKNAERTVAENKLKQKRKELIIPQKNDAGQLAVNQVQKGSNATLEYKIPNGGKMSKVDDILSKVDAAEIKLKILMGGKTGVGKSSLVNSIVGKEICKVGEGGGSCTAKNQVIPWDNGVMPLEVVDVPGFGEPGSPTINGVDYIENVRRLAHDAHLFIMVLKCDDKALHLEECFIEQWFSDTQLSKVPFILAINQLAKANPFRDWDPINLNLENPTTKKELNISSYIDSVKRIPVIKKIDSKNIFAIDTGERFEDPKYGIEELKSKISSLYPDIFDLIVNREKYSIAENASKLINRYSIGAGALCIEPVPLADSLLLAPLQIAMVMHLGNLYGVKMTKAFASGLLSTLGLSLMGTWLFQAIVSLVPGVKQVIGPVIGFTLTYTTGFVVKEMLETGNLNPSKDEIAKLVSKYKGRAEVESRKVKSFKTQPSNS